MSAAKIKFSSLLNFILLLILISLLPLINFLRIYSVSLLFFRHFLLLLLFCFGASFTFSFSSSSCSFTCIFSSSTPVFLIRYFSSSFSSCVTVFVHLQISLDFPLSSLLSFQYFHAIKLTVALGQAEKYVLRSSVLLIMLN